MSSDTEKRLGGQSRMTVDAARLMALDFAPGRQTVTAKDAILYAISVGYAGQSATANDLSPLYERVLKPVSTFATVVARPNEESIRQSGIDFAKVVHAEHRLILHREIPIGVELESRTRMQSVVDRGPGRGMFASFERIIAAASDNAPIATMVQTNACRGDGGCGSAGAPPDPLTRPPDRRPDLLLDVRIPHSAGILYRLNGDLNPLHIDPELAGKAGFPRPILHGLCTFGYAGYAVSKLVPIRGSDAIQAIAARFTAPLYPGETLRTELWMDEGGPRFRCRSVERDIVVLDAGAATIGPFR